MGSAEEESAAKRPSGDGGTETGQLTRRLLLLFRAGGEWFGLPIEEVKEVQPLSKITRIPHAPGEILGIMNLRGKVLTLYDLLALLQAPGRTVQEGDQVIVLSLDPELVMGIVVERIGQVKEVPFDALESPFQSRPGPLKGTLDVDGIAVGILDLKKLFAPFLGLVRP